MKALSLVYTTAIGLALTVQLWEIGIISAEPTDEADLLIAVDSETVDETADTNDVLIRENQGFNSDDDAITERVKRYPRGNII